MLRGGKDLLWLSFLNHIAVCHKEHPVRRAKPISWVTMTIVIPDFASSFMTFKTSPTSSGSSAEVGSSKRSAFGCIASALAMATRCFCPPERVTGFTFPPLFQLCPR